MKSIKLFAIVTIIAGASTMNCNAQSNYQNNKKPSWSKRIFNSLTGKKVPRNNDAQMLQSLKASEDPEIKDLQDKLTDLKSDIKTCERQKQNMYTNETRHEYAKGYHSRRVNRS